MSKPRRKKRSPKRVLALPDLEQSKTAVLNSITSKSGQRTYGRAITDFVEWYCSKPRLAFNRTVVLRYRIFLEQRQYAPTTINLRLAAVRRLAFEASDSGLLSPELNGVLQLLLAAEIPFGSLDRMTGLVLSLRTADGETRMQSGEIARPLATRRQ